MLRSELGLAAESSSPYSIRIKRIASARLILAFLFFFFTVDLSNCIHNHIAYCTRRRWLSHSSVVWCRLLVAADDCCGGWRTGSRLHCDIYHLARQSSAWLIDFFWSYLLL
jgi:ectoine hydroxylase-related dioxygenase (phytanoyl-CoA dioxygenase family)